jgi:hypothetical protein
MCDEIPDELVKAVADGRALVYVGAGASKSAGLPDWKELLEQLKHLADGSINDPADRRYFKQLVDNSKNIEVADWLELVFKEPHLMALLGKTLHRPDCQPSVIHRNIARIPFVMALTTNYDNLLYDAFRDLERDNATLEDGHGRQKEPHPRTNDATVQERVVKDLKWGDHLVVVQNLKDPNSLIHLRIHGKTDDYSARLTTRHYRELMYENRRFRDLLMWLFTTNTCLFVGASIEDPDLVYLLSEAYTEYRNHFGPHYALLPVSKAPPFRQELLREQFNIEVISLRDEDASVVSDATKSQLHPMTFEASRILRNLSGEATLERFRASPPHWPTSDDKGFFLMKALGTLLTQVCRLTGSLRGDFCLHRDGPGTNVGRQLQYVVNRGPTTTDIPNRTVLPDSICGIAYYKAPENGVYVPNVEDRQIANFAHYGPINYLPGWPDVASEFAVPVVADGVRVGVLNIESRWIDAYSSGHLEIARQFAKKAGRLYGATTELQRSGGRLEAARIEDDYTRLRQLFLDLRKVRADSQPIDDLSFLAYRVDYMFGKLTAQNPNSTVLGLPKGTEECEVPQCDIDNVESLPAQTFWNGRPIVLPNATEAISAGKFPDWFAGKLKMTGAVIALPIFTRGHVAGVAVAWCPNGQNRCLDGKDVDLFRRTVHLISNLDRSAEERATKAFGANVRPTPRFTTSEKIIQLFTSASVRPAQSAAPVSSSSLDRMGQSWQAEISSLIRGLLMLFRDQERLRFRDGNPKGWLSPRRCRCWIKIKSEGHPRFVLVLQVAIDPHDPDRNLFSPVSENRGCVIVSEPYPLASDLVSSAVDEEDTTRDNTDWEPISLYFDGAQLAAKTILVPRNWHQSLLLSRIKVDRFSRILRPTLLKEDILATILRKDKKKPWFSSPIISVEESEWVRGETENRLVGYLTFDDGASDLLQLVPHYEEVDLKQWTAFQEDILHQLDLFSACLAERRGVHALIDKITTSSPSQSTTRASA